MIRFIIRRLIGAFVVLVVVTFATIWLLIWVPQNVLHEDLGFLFVGRHPSPSQLAAINHRFGFDLSIWEQYWQWFKGLFSTRVFDDGTNSPVQCHAPCLGYSYRLNETVTSILKGDLPVDLSLAAGAAILWLVSGVAVGTISALRRGSFFDRSLMTVTLAAVSLPIFFTGPMLQLAFSYNLKWLPATGYVGLSSPWEWFKHLILPWIALAFLFAALYARLTRANMLETMGEDYIRTARAKGLARPAVIKHGLRAAITPIVTIFGLDFGQLIGTAVITETIFNLPGIGKQTVTALAQHDFPVIIGVTLIAALAVVVANLIVDIAYAFVDPRVSYS